MTAALTVLPLNLGEACKGSGRISRGMLRHLRALGCSQKVQPHALTLRHSCNVRRRGGAAAGRLRGVPCRRSTHAAHFLQQPSRILNRLSMGSAGEVAAQDICVECSVGTYSFDSSVPCQSCPEGAACYGASRALVTVKPAGRLLCRTTRL